MNARWRVNESAHQCTKNVRTTHLSEQSVYKIQEAGDEGQILHLEGRYILTRRSTPQHRVDNCLSTQRRSHSHLGIIQMRETHPSPSAR